MICSYRDWDIICDICGVDYALSPMHQWDTLRAEKENKYLQNGTLSEIGRRDVRKLAKNDNWIYKNKKDICPNCQRKENA
jgi:hypothetical protein